VNRYVFLNAVPGKAYCALQNVENLKEPLRITKGVKLEPWPEDVRFHMDPNFPKSIELADCITNLADAIVVSKKFKELIESAKPAKVEYLPVTIINHKGKLASADYFIVNPCELQDCIDREQSVLKWNAINPDLISISKKLVIDEAKVSPKAKVFRIKHYPFKAVFARELADEVKAAGLTGVKFTEIA
jgi:Immunity protein family (Imm11)